MKVVDISDFSNGKNKKNFELLPAEEFIARVTQHIPEKGNKPMNQENRRKNLLKIRKELSEFLKKEKRKVFSGRKKG